MGNETLEREVVEAPRGATTPEYKEPQEQSAGPEGPYIGGKKGGVSNVGPKGGK